MPTENIYERDFPCGDFRVNLMGKEGKDKGSVTLRFYLKPTPIQMLASGLEKCCADASVALEPGDNPVKEYDYLKRREYSIPNGKLALVECSGEHGFPRQSVVHVEIEKGTMAEAVAEAKSVYGELRPFIRKLGYDTAQFDSYMSDFDEGKIRAGSVLGTPLGEGAIVVQISGKGPAELRSVMEGMVGGPDGISDVIREHMERLAGVAGPGNIPDAVRAHLESIGSIARAYGGLVEAQPRQRPAKRDGFIVKCGNCQETHVFERTGRATEEQSLYARLIRERARSKDKVDKYEIGMPNDAVGSLFREAHLYHLRGHVLYNDGDYVNARKDGDRAVRILDYLMAHLPETDARRARRINTLQLRAVAESNRAITESKIAGADGDFSKVQRICDRAEKFLHDFYKENFDFDVSPESFPNAVEFGMRMNENANLIKQRDELLENLAIIKQDAGIERRQSTTGDYSTKFSVTELPLDEHVANLEGQLQALSDKEKYEEAAKVRDHLKKAKALLERSDREDPLELRTSYTLE